MIFVREYNEGNKEIITSRRGYLQKLAIDLVRPHREGCLKAPRREVA